MEISSYGEISFNILMEVWFVAEQDQNSSVSIERLLQLSSWLDPFKDLNFNVNELKCFVNK